jgi:TetR/AcrR family transcriptional regulator
MDAAAAAHQHKRMHGEDRRRQILEVAIDLFSKRGFGGTTTKQIAEAAGVSEAIIFRHFATKQDLYTAILDFQAQECGKPQWMADLQEIAKMQDDEKLFRAVATGMLANFKAAPAFQRLVAYSALDGHEFSQILHSRALPFRSFLCDYIAKRQEAGALKNLSPSLVIFALISLPAHFGLLTKVFGFDVVQATDEEAVNAFVEILLNGIRI